MKVNNKGGSFGLPADLAEELNRVKAGSDKGSFNIPKDMLDEHNKEEGDAIYPENSEPEQVDQEALRKKEEEEKNEELLKEIKENLNIELSEDDLWNALFNSSLKKSGITIFPGKMEATFKYSLSMEEMGQIDKAMAEALEYKLMESGFKSLNTRHLLSHAVLELGKPGKLKSIGNTAEERFEELGKMSTLVVDNLAKRWNMFVYYVDSELNKDSTGKK